MKTFFRLCLGLWLVCPVGLWASASLEHARNAQAMLGPATWSRVVRVTNTGSRSNYPAEFDALIFEFSGILWFYADVDGTQSLSLETNRLAADEADLGPLVRAIEPGLVLRETVADAARGHRVGQGGVERPPNDCFIASVAALQALLERGEVIAQARLLSFYVDTARGRLGHTVLTYETPSGAFAFDPAWAGRRRKLAGRLTDDALALARFLQGSDAVVKARWVPTLVRPAGRLAALDRGAVAAGGGRSRWLR